MQLTWGYLPVVDSLNGYAIATSMGHKKANTGLESAKKKCIAASS